MIDEILAAARSCLETPFRHQGRIPGRSLDCAGLAVVALQSVGIPVDDVRGYSRLPHKGRLQAALDAQPALERVTDIQAGDILLMKFGSEPQHLAICAGETIIHAYEQAGKTCEHGFTDEWRNRVVRAYRVRGSV